MVLPELDGLIKSKYMNGVKDQMNRTVDFVESLPKSAEKPSGLDAAGNAIFKVPVNLVARQSGGAQNSNEQIRTPEPGTKKQAGIVAKINIWPIDMTKFCIAASQGNVVQGASGIDYEFTDAEKSFRKDRNRQAFGIGNGALGTVNGAVSSSTSVVVDDLQYLIEGMRVDIYSSTTLQASNVLITAITESTKTLTMAQAVVCSDDAVIVRAGTRTSAPTDGKEIMGLKGLCDDGDEVATFQGLARGTYGIWKGVVIDMSSAALTADNLQRLADKVETKSGMPIGRIVSHRNQRRAYLNLTLPLKRFNDDNVDAGFSRMSWNGHNWDLSFECQKDIIYMYGEGAVERFVLQDMKLDDSNGNVLKEKVGYDGVYAYYKSYENLGTTQPNAIGRLEGLATLSE